MPVDIHRVQAPILRRLRRKRMSQLAEWARLDSTTRVLDVGGNPMVWDLVPVVPDVTLLNLEPSVTTLQQVLADGERLPFRDDAFDVVFSNSVIEHVADHEALANEIQRVGISYFVQTPNRAFPFEPHVMTPMVNYLPKRWQRRLYRNFTLWGWLTRPSPEYVDGVVAEINLLGQAEMKRLFPDGEVHVGRSLIVKGPIRARVPSESS